MADKQEATPISQRRVQVVSKPISTGKLPVLLDIIFDLSNLIMIVIAMTVAIVSYISGATFVDIAIRTGVTLITVGFLLYVITKKIVSASIEVTSQMVEEATTTPTIDEQG
jgi:hypothetical protein